MGNIHTKALHAVRSANRVDPTMVRDSACPSETGFVFHLVHDRGHRGGDMNQKFDAELKIRMPRKLKNQLTEAAMAAGKSDVSQHVRDILVSRQQAAQVEDVLKRMEQMMADIAPWLRPKTGDDPTLARLTRLECIVEELAMHASPQVMPRVAARLKTQSQSVERTVQ